jgi:sulfatase maturation enzyme AslB (radical SAM superfamily)
MTTNVTLLDKEKIDFLFDHKIYPLLSIDGAKETQDYNRPCQDGTSSFDKVYKNLPYLLEKMPNLTFRSTILQDTVKNTFKNYLFAEVMGFRQYFTIPNCREKWTEENKNILKNEIKKIFLYEIDHFLRNELPINFSR